MSDWVYYGKCETGSHSAFFVRKRMVLLPTGQTAKSQKKMCGKCYDKVKQMLATNKIPHNGNLT